MDGRPCGIGPFHIISYGTLLGAQAYQSCFAGVTALRTLPRPQFSKLQASIFPVYFGLQTVLPVVLAVTYPGRLTSEGGFAASSIPGVLADEQRSTTLLPLAVTFLSGLTNLVFLGPATSRISRQRAAQEAIDGKKSADPPPHSKEMIQLRKSFIRVHGLSTVINFIGLAATVYYGKSLSDRLI